MVKAGAPFALLVLLAPVIASNVFYFDKQVYVYGDEMVPERFAVLQTLYQGYLDVQSPATSLAFAWSAILPSEPKQTPIKRHWIEFIRSDSLSQRRETFYDQLLFSDFPLSSLISTVILRSSQLVPPHFNASPGHRLDTERLALSLEAAVMSLLGSCDLRDFLGIIIGAEALAWAAHRLFYFGVDTQTVERLLQRVHLGIQRHLEVLAENKGTPNQKVFRKLAKYLVPRPETKRFLFMKISEGLKFPKTMKPREPERMSGRGRLG